MAEGEEKPLLASIRYYGDKSNKVYLIDPLMIKDFVSVDTFDFTIPHLITKIVAGKKIEEPAQVFAISDDQKELEEPPRRRIFDNKRRSDVLVQLLESQEKSEKRKKSTRTKDDDNMNTDGPKESNSAECPQQSKAKELKAMQKKVKDDARTFAKSLDEQIMAQKMDTLKQNKLNYTDDPTELQRKEKELNDLKMALDIQNKKLAEMQAKYKEDKENLENNCQRKKELLEKCRNIIYTLQNKNENAGDIATTEVFADAELKKSVGLSLVSDGTPFCDLTNLNSTSDFNFELNTLCMQPEAIDKQTSFQVLSEILNDKSEGSGFPKDDRIATLSLPNDGSVDLGYCPSGREFNDDLLKSDKMKNENKQRRRHKKIKGREQEKESDDEKQNMAQKTDLQEAGNEGIKDLTYKEKSDTVGADDDEEESFEDTRTKKHKRSSYVPTKKYGDLHSSSQSENDSDDGKKKRFSRDSDDEYLSDELTKSAMPNYKSYKEETGKKRRLYHLKHNISIKRDTWEELKKIFNVKEWLRILIHAIFKEEELIDKVFDIGAAKQNRLPGRKRTEFTLDEKSVIRSTFFCRVDQIVKSRKAANGHKHNWKSYISEHINYLIKREQDQRQKRERQKKRKAQMAARRVSSSTSSQDDSEATE